MKATCDIKLECLRLAVSLAVSKNLRPADVVLYAMDFFKWINGADGKASARDIAPLVGEYARRS
jgi:hypothetical protein